MKKSLMGLLVILGLVSSAVVMAAEGIKSSTVVNTTTNIGGNVTAVSKDSTAQMGVIDVKGGIDKSTVVNTTTNKGGNVTAVGEGSTAQMGVIKVQ